MTDPPHKEPRRALADGIVTELLASGRAENMLSQLRQDYRRLSYHRLEDAVADAFVALYRKLLGEDVSAPLD